MSDVTTTAAPAAPPATPPATTTPPAERPPESPNLLNNILQGMERRSKQARQQPAKPPETDPATEKPQADPPPENKTKGDQTEDPPKETKTEEQPKAKPEAPRRPSRYKVTDRAKQQEETKKVVSEVVGEVLPKVLKAVQPTPASNEPKAPEIPEMFKHDLEVYEALERIYPERYGNGKLVKALAESERRINAYRTKWQSENPDQEFNEEEHRDELDKLIPNISTREISRAQSEITTNQRLDAEEKKRQEKEREASKQQRSQTLEQVAAGAEKEFNRTIAVAVDPELDALIKAGDPAKVDERIKSNRVAHLVGNDVARRYNPIYSRAAVIFTPEGAPDPNKPLSDIDGEIYGRVIPSMERYLDGKEVNGRPFLPVAEFLQLSPLEQRQYSTVSRELVLEYIQALATAEIHQLKQEIGLNGRPNGQPVAGKTAPPATAGESTKPPVNNGSNASGVGAPGGGPVVSTGATRPLSPTDARGKFIAGLSGR